MQVHSNGYDTSIWKRLGKERITIQFIQWLTDTSQPHSATSQGYDLIWALYRGNHRWYDFTLVGRFQLQITYITKCQGILGKQGNQRKFRSFNNIPSNSNPISFHTSRRIFKHDSFERKLWTYVFMPYPIRYLHAVEAIPERDLKLGKKTSLNIFSRHKRHHHD